MSLGKVHTKHRGDENLCGKAVPITDLFEKLLASEVSCNNYKYISKIINAAYDDQIGTLRSN